METIIKKAIELRKVDNHEESRKLLLELLSDAQYKAKAHLQIAWSFDNEGKEHDAISHYKLALVGPLSEKEHFDVLFGLASTFRSVGEYDKALQYFEKTISDYPDSIEVKPFYAMCLYNLGRSNEAIKLLLELLISTTSSESIKKYQRAILLYSKDLDRLW